VTWVSRGTRIGVRAFQALAFAGLATYTAQAAFAICGTAATGFFETWVYTGLIAAGAVLCLARAATVRRERAAWLVLGAGLCSWAGGEVYYAAVLADMAAPPLPSVADALWLAWFPAAYVGIVLLLRQRVRGFRRSLWLDGLVGALAVAAFGAALLVESVTASGADTRTVAVDLTYLSADLLLIAFVVGVFAVSGWRPGRAWAILGAGLVAGAAVDGFFFYQAATGVLGNSTVPAALWPLSALLVGCAAWQRPVTRTVTLEGWRVIALPALFALLALGLLAYHAFEPLHTAALLLAMATLVVVIARMALTFRENLHLIEGTRREAMTDALTGLGNRRRLMADLAHAVDGATEERPCALVMFDLDGFKQYNDRFGHPVGDALLARLGRRFREAVAGSGDAYRLGGDEFCLVASGTREELAALAAEAHESLRDSGQGFEVTSSHGMVLIPDEAPDVSHALNLADERLYDEKGESRRTTVTRQTSDALLQVLKECQPGLDGHLNEVAGLARRVGRGLGLRAAELDEVTHAAELHDIGKVAVPEGILAKDGPLDADEWEFMRQHTLVGDRILSAAPDLSSVARLVRASHERFDGKGYPDGLAGDEIPMGARIVAICDAFHAMTAGRPYREPVPAGVAVAELQRCAGGQFDPTVVDAFCAMVASALGDAAEANRHGNGHTAETNGNGNGNGHTAETNGNDKGNGHAPAPTAADLIGS